MPTRATGTPSFTPEQGVDGEAFFRHWEEKQERLRALAKIE